MTRPFDPITPRGLAELGRALGTWWRRRARPGRVRIRVVLEPGITSSLYLVRPRHRTFCPHTREQQIADERAATALALATGAGISGCGRIGHGYHIHARTGHGTVVTMFTTRPELPHVLTRGRIEHAERDTPDVHDADGRGIPSGYRNTSPRDPRSGFPSAAPAANLPRPERGSRDD